MIIKIDLDFTLFYYIKLISDNDDKPNIGYLEALINGLKSKPGIPSPVRITLGIVLSYLKKKDFSEKSKDNLYTTLQNIARKYTFDFAVVLYLLTLKWDLEKMFSSIDDRKETMSDLHYKKMCEWYKNITDLRDRLEDETNIPFIIHSPVELDL